MSWAGISDSCQHDRDWTFAEINSFSTMPQGFLPQVLHSPQLDMARYRLLTTKEQPMGGLMANSLCITGSSKPWLMFVGVYSLCLGKLLASYSRSSMCQGAGTTDHCVSSPDPRTPSSADRYRQLSGHFPPDPDTGRDFWTVLLSTTLIAEIEASDKSPAWPVLDLSCQHLESHGDTA